VKQAGALHDSKFKAAMAFVVAFEESLDGAYVFSPALCWCNAKLQREGLWDKFYTDAPARQRLCVEQYNLVKRA
jgi:hypothetical protein